DLAHGTFSRDLHRAVGVTNVEQVILGVVDQPEDGEVDVDDVLVASQHQRFLGHLKLLTFAAVADLDAVDARHLGDQHALERRRQVIVESGRGVPVIGAETQHHAEFIGIDDIDAAGEPEHDHRGDDDEDALAAAGLARQQIADALLQAAEESLEVGRPYAAAASPWRSAAAPRSAAATARR